MENKVFVIYATCSLQITEAAVSKKPERLFDEHFSAYETVSSSRSAMRQSSPAAQISWVWSRVRFFFVISRFVVLHLTEYSLFEENCSIHPNALHTLLGTRRLPTLLFIALCASGTSQRNSKSPIFFPQRTTLMFRRCNSDW